MGVCMYGGCLYGVCLYVLLVRECLSVWCVFMTVSVCLYVMHVDGLYVMSYWAVIEH